MTSGPGVTSEGGCVGRRRQGRLTGGGALPVGARDNSTIESVGSEDFVVADP